MYNALNYTCQKYLHYAFVIMTLAMPPLLAGHKFGALVTTPFTIRVPIPLILEVDLVPPVDAGLLAIISSEMPAVISGYGLISRSLTQSLHL